MPLGMTKLPKDLPNKNPNRKYVKLLFELLARESKKFSK